jgi:dihydrodipicolinate reductase
VELAARCAKLGGPALLLGATGFQPDQLVAIAEAAKVIPIVRAGNFSLGINMLLGLVSRPLRALPADAYDIEVFEAPPSPQGRCPFRRRLMLGEAAAPRPGVKLAQVERRARDGITGARVAGEIGFSVLRGRRHRGRAQRHLRRRGRDPHPFSTPPATAACSPEAPSPPPLGRRSASGANTTCRTCWGSG